MLDLADILAKSGQIGCPGVALVSVGAAWSDTKYVEAIDREDGGDLSGQYGDAG